MLSIYFPNYEKLKYFVETLTGYNQILILRKSYVFHCGFLYLILMTRPKLTVWLCEGVEVTQWANVQMLKVHKIENFLTPILEFALFLC